MSSGKLEPTGGSAEQTLPQTQQVVTPTEVPQDNLQEVWHAHSHLNGDSSKCLFLCSWPDTDAQGAQDTFLIHWVFPMMYMFPPVPMILMIF